MKVRILTENVRGLGLGHVARCFNLSCVFLNMGYEVDFFVRGDANFTKFLKAQMESSLDSKDCIFKRFYPLALQWENITNDNLIACDICIIDSYHTSKFMPFLESCFKNCKVVCLLDDDGRFIQLFKKNIPNLFILNPNGLYNVEGLESSRIFSGLQYAMLNECFLDSTKLKNMKKKYDFFVCLGGEDKNDVSSEIFKKLQDFGFSSCVVLGANYKGELLKESKDYIFFNITQKKVAALMAQSKACIVSGGGIIFEALSVNKNVFAINLASNQDKQIEILRAQGLVHEISRNFSHKDLLQNNLDSKEVKIGNCLQDLVGNFCIFAINYSLNLASEKKAKNFNITIKDSNITLNAINFCNLSASESLRVLRYRNHPFVSKSMYGSPNISAKTHFDFISSLHNDSYSKYFLVQNNLNLRTDIGVVSLTRINLKHKHAYLGIYKNPFLESKHIESNKTLRYGEQLIEVLKYIAFSEYNLHMLYLEVVESNTRAIKLYEKSGFNSCGRLKECFFINDKFKDIMVYELKTPNVF